MEGERPILIAGAGIGGLTAAIALADKGFSVQVLEKAERPAEAGAGVQIAPNASRVLLALGLGRLLGPVASTPEALVVRRGSDGAVLAEAELGDAAARRFGAPWWTIHRADLHAALLARAAEHDRIDVAYGAGVSEVEPIEAGVRAALAGGSVNGAAIIGADGLWSRVRASLGDKAAPVPTGKLAYRTTIDRERAPDLFARPATGLWIGAAGHLVHYSVSAGARVNVVAIIDGAAGADMWSEPATGSQVAPHFSQWASPIRDLIAAGETWTRWPLLERPVWFGPGRGEATLLGDAAHPMTPFLSQGAAMAIEDAATLAASLSSQGSIAAGFRAYEAARRGRATQMQRRSRLNGQTFHASGLVAAVRDRVIATLGGDRLIAGNAWIYDWRVG